MRVSVRRGAKELGHSGRGDEAGTQARVQGLGGNVPPNTHHMLEKPRGTTPPADPKASFHQQGREGEPRPRSVRRPNPGRRKTEEREKAPNKHRGGPCLANIYHSDCRSLPDHGDGLEAAVLGRPHRKSFNMACP